MLASLALCVLASASVQDYRQRFPLPDLTVPNGWGVNIHFNDPQPGEMEKIAAAGFRWIRQDLAWHQVEKEKGKYDFEPLARLFDACEKNRVRPLIILDYGNDLYQEGSPRTPESRAAFCRMVEALMARFKGRGAVWEMWNEPNIFFWQPKSNVEEYIPLATEVGKTIRRVAPEEYYVGPATSGFDWTFLERCFQAGLLEYWDAVTVHPYRQTEPESVIPDWGRLRRLVDQYAPKGKVVPMLSGEWGYSELYSAMDKNRQGAYIARQYLSNLASGVGLSIWYDWKDDGTDPKEVEHHFGTVLPDLAEKPAYGAARSLSKALDGYTFHMRLAQRSSDDVLMAFRRGSDLKYVGWTKRAASSQVVLPHGATLRVGASPSIVDAPRGASKDLVLGWRALPQVVSVGSDEEARRANEQLKEGVPKGALIQMPVIRDDASEPQKTVRVRIAKGPVAITQEALVVQPKPIRLSLMARSGKAVVVVENPGGRSFTGTLGIRQGNLKKESEIRLDPANRTMIRETSLPVAMGPLNVALVEAPPARTGSIRPDRLPVLKVLAQVQNVSVVPVPLDAESVEIVDEDDPKLKGTYATSFEGEARVKYEFPVGWKFFTLRPKGEGARPIEGRPKELNMMVWGDGSGDILRMRFTDATGQTFQPDYGPITWKGWKPVSFSLSESASGRWGGANDGRIHYPIHIEALTLVDSWGGRGGKGEVGIKDVAITK
jgi:hypothetical protein